VNCSPEKGTPVVGRETHGGNRQKLCEEQRKEAWSYFLPVTVRGKREKSEENPPSPARKEKKTRLDTYRKRGKGGTERLRFAHRGENTAESLMMAEREYVNTWKKERKGR